MPTFFVHRYDVVRVKVAVEAEDHAGAMKAADDYLEHNHPIPNRYLFPVGIDEESQIAPGLLPTWLQVEDPGQEIVGYLVDEPGDPECQNSRSYDAAVQPEFGCWEDQTDFPTEDWRIEVANGDTRLGYAAWVSAQRVSAAQPADRPICDEIEGDCA